MTGKLLASIFLSVLFLWNGLILAGAAPLKHRSEPVPEYGHISLTDEGVQVLRLDRSRQMAKVNLPIGPGDLLITGEKERCELQFDNGTLLRLDKNSRLRVTTIHAPTITSSQKITTLNLEKGRIYAMIQRYNRELFQIITPHAAIQFKSGTMATLQLKEKDETGLWVEKGRCQVMFGREINAIKTKNARAGNGYLISTGDFKGSQEKPELEFSCWNQDKNAQYITLHQGIGRVPQAVRRFSQGLVKWAERWSTLYGEWLYDDLFGYVWKPADEIFSLSKRPFYHADFMRVRGEIFLVPQQPWGWIPAHMGTWIWMKWGWTWIPGNTFNAGVGTRNPYMQFNTLDYWIHTIYGNYELYYTYRQQGRKAWQQHYRQEIGKTPPKADLKGVPESVRAILKAINKAPQGALQNKLGNYRPNPIYDPTKLTPLLNTRFAKPVLLEQKTRPLIFSTMDHNLSSLWYIPGIPGLLRPEPTLNPHSIKENAAKAGRDFNPDIRWSLQHGIPIHYSSQKNSMICPTLNLNAKTMTISKRFLLLHSPLPQAYRSIATGSVDEIGNTSGNNNTSLLPYMAENSDTKREAEINHSTENK